jgi:O-antigen/teichoic acid export membrane protein
MRWRVFAGEVTMGTLYVNMDLLVVSWLAGESAAGLYNAAWKFVRLGTVFARSITTSLFPVMSRMYVDSKSGFDQLFRYTIRIMCITVIPVSVGVMILSDRLVELLYTEEFFATSSILCVLIWVMLVDVINAFLSRVLFAQTRQRASMYSAAIGLAVNCLFIFYLVHRFSGIGAAYALLISGVCSMLYSLLAATDKKSIIELFREAMLVFLAAVIMGVVVYVLRDAWLPLITTVAILIYTPMLWILRIVDSQDVEFLQKTLLRKSAVS